ncbi:hypothetical protein COTS27_01161 [Spirochaetota bacterium]|nr:hypothetical protein COTS27_01161 [Spirochaetota bacterium]
MRTTSPMIRLMCPANIASITVIGVIILSIPFLYAQSPVDEKKPNPTHTSTSQELPAQFSPLPDLENNELFKKIETIFKFDTHNAKARALSALLKHYQLELTKLERTAKNNTTSKQSPPPPNAATKTSTPDAQPIKKAKKQSQYNNSSPHHEDRDNNNNSRNVKTDAPPADKDNSYQQEEAFSIERLLYQTYYEPLIIDFFKPPQKIEITLALLDWIASIPLNEHFNLLKDILTAEKTTDQVPPPPIVLKIKALETLQVLTIPAAEKNFIFLSYIKNPKVHLNNDTLITHAVTGLAGAGGEPIAGELRKLFITVENNDLKISILRSISEFGFEKDVDFFLKVLNSREVDPVLWTALVALKNYPHVPKAETLLLSYAEDKDPNLAARAIYALSTFTNDIVYETLLKATEDNHPLIRMQSLNALNDHQRHTDDISDLQPLIEYKEIYDDDPSVRETARKILRSRNLPTHSEK